MTVPNDVYFQSCQFMFRGLSGFCFSVDFWSFFLQSLTSFYNCVTDSRSENSFSVGLSHHFSGTDLIFDRVFSNRGGGYSSVTGHFTAKESGVYVFHFHALSRSDAKVWAELYHNYHYIDSLYGRSNGEFAAGSNAAVLDLVAGDTVFLKSRQTSNSYFGAPDEVYCTFSGYKLDFEGEPIIGNPGEIIG